MNLFVHYLKSTLHRVDDFDLSVGRQHFHAASPIYSSLSTSQLPELNTFICVKEKKRKHILATNNNNGFYLLTYSASGRKNVVKIRPNALHMQAYYRSAEKQIITEPFWTHVK